MLPTMFIVAGPNGAREELLAPTAGCEAVEVMEATAMGSTLGPGPKDTLVPSTGLPRSWFSVSGWGWFTWNGLTGPEAAAAPGESRRDSGWSEQHLPSRPVAGAPRFLLGHRALGSPAGTRRHVCLQNESPLFA